MESLSIGTDGSFVRETFGEISATTYIEGIVARRHSGTTQVRPGPCRRRCGQFSGFVVHRELYDVADIQIVRDIVHRLGLNKDDYLYYRRDFVSNAIYSIGLTTKVYNRWSVLAVPVTFTAAELFQVQKFLEQHREILAQRVPY